MVQKVTAALARPDQSPPGPRRGPVCVHLRAGEPNLRLGVHVPKTTCSAGPFFSPSHQSAWLTVLELTLSGEIWGQVTLCVKVVTYDLWHRCVRQTLSVQQAFPYRFQFCSLSPDLKFKHNHKSNLNTYFKH
ncbi:unnamed protein product [Pleuronectes platessa]|uniref:Uncharacterized protein n=1 Tax=Pleuronectes platessa TaxID=8262 RepID=A0A9N7YG73_PLEPL|nr:unnamed protein product [Pleuronectes platessa]